MSAIRLNGQYVLLRDVEKKDFMSFIQLCLPKVTMEEAIPHTLANFWVNGISELLGQLIPSQRCFGFAPTGQSFRQASQNIRVKCG